MPEQRLSEKISRWRVRAAIAGVVLVIILARPSWISLVTGEIICAVGLLIRGWACGHIHKEKKLTTSGPYRYTRNPL
jgi:protein-S-isoprenylcysteine O-methyltransferase Ste14